MSRRYCIRGHDTDVVGRVQRMCRECRRQGDRRRNQTRRRQLSRRRWWDRSGYLKQLNTRVEQALRRMEVWLGSHR